MKLPIFILYVADQEASCRFYRELLGTPPVLDVPGMTEFKLHGGTSLGLMPEAGIASILGDQVPHPNTGNGIPRAELYLFTEDLDESYARLIRAGGTAVSPPAPRNWGDNVAYGLDPDGHVIALALADQVSSPSKPLD